MPATIGSRCLAVLAIALAAGTAGCSHGPRVPGDNPPTAAPVYPGAKTISANVFTTGDSFDTVYAFYKKNLPADSQESHVSTPQKATTFLFGTGNDRMSVTIAPSPLCCRTLILIRARESVSAG